MPLKNMQGGAEPLMRRVELPETIRGHLFLASMPGRYEPIEKFLSDTVENKIDCVVCLASPDEIRQRSPVYATLLAGMVPWEHIPFAIANCRVSAEDALKSLPGEIATRLHDGSNVLIHCDSGIGRAGTVAVAVLLNFWSQHSIQNRQRRA